MGICSTKWTKSSLGILELHWKISSFLSILPDLSSTKYDVFHQFWGFVSLEFSLRPHRISMMKLLGWCGSHPRLVVTLCSSFSGKFLPITFRTSQFFSNQLRFKRNKPQLNSAFFGVLWALYTGRHTYAKLTRSLCKE